MGVILYRGFKSSGNLTEATYDALRKQLYERGETLVEIEPITGWAAFNHLGWRVIPSSAYRSNHAAHLTTTGGKRYLATFGLIFGQKVVDLELKSAA